MLSLLPSCDISVPSTFEVMPGIWKSGIPSRSVTDTVAKAVTTSTWMRKRWDNAGIKRTLSGGVPAVEQAQASDANRSGCLICEFAVPAQTQIDEIDCHTLGLTLIDSEGGEGVNKPPCPVEKLLIRVEEPSDQTAADLAAALHLFIRHHHSGQVEGHSLSVKVES